MSKYITIGCSHTNGTYLPPEDHWITMLSAKRADTNFFRVSKNAAGLSFLVLYTKQYIQKGQLDPDKVEYVIIQKPKAYRHPFWGKDKSGYRYIKKNDPRDIVSVSSGMHQAMHRWKRLSAKKKAITSKMIFQEQLDHLIELKNMFPAAKFAYYHYWGDYIAECITRPLLAEVNVQLGIEASKLGMDNWETIIDPKDIDGVYDDEGDILMSRRQLFNDGWIRAPKDAHPVKRHHDIVSQKVESWLATHES